MSDIWPHMAMNEAILTWWEYTGERRWLYRAATLFVSDTSALTFGLDCAIIRAVISVRNAHGSIVADEYGIHLTFVTANGLARNAYANSVQSEVTLDDLFRS